jgi:hypothetical protein
MPRFAGTSSVGSFFPLPADELQTRDAADDARPVRALGDEEPVLDVPRAGAAADDGEAAGQVGGAAERGLRGRVRGHCRNCMPGRVILRASCHYGS